MDDDTHQAATSGVRLDLQRDFFFKNFFLELWCFKLLENDSLYPILIIIIFHIIFHIHQLCDFVLTCFIKGDHDLK
jgi:hypothetical protein